MGKPTYAKVGYNKREELSKNGISTDAVMGRKGIGKLAALYLSDNYYILTKTCSAKSNWQMIYREDVKNEDDKPFLEEVSTDIGVNCIKEWSQVQTGTLLKLNNVNLTGLGESAFRSLEHKLSNYFSLDSMSNKKIMLCVQEKAGSVNFSEVSKAIAFKNMAYIEYSALNEKSLLEKINVAEDVKIKIPYPKLNNEFYEHTINLSEFNAINVKGEYKGQNQNGEFVIRPYILNGWIGIHSTITTAQAQENDINFTKNQFYNPIQLRLYVRKKLAIENFLNLINNTQAFVNYIEGEISFDILDDDHFPDIATSNRQSLDEHDERVDLLKGIITPLIKDLIRKRNELAEKVRKQQEEIRALRETSAKTQFSKELEKEVESFKTLTTEEKADFTRVVTNKIRGEVVLKDNYVIFFSHSRADKRFTDFLYKLLIKKGVRQEEIFYTSKDNDPEKYENKTELSIQIKNNIINDNVLLLYLTSEEYKKSEYCMFEGGAGWATRSVGEYIVLSIKYENIPKYLTNGKREFCLLEKNIIKLDRERYLFIVNVLNRLIEHVNTGRIQKNQATVPLFPITLIPEDIELNKKGQDIEMYMDDMIIEHWNYYVKIGLDEYLDNVVKGA